MKYSEESINEFFDQLLTASKEKEKTVLDLSKTTTALVGIEIKSAKADKKEKSDEKKHKNRLKQLSDRKEKTQKGPFEEMFGGTNKTKETNGMSKWLLAALGLGAAGLGVGWLMSDDPNAKKIRDAIGDAISEGVEMLTDAIQEAVDQAVDDLSATLRKWAEDTVRGTGFGGSTTPGEQEAATEEAEGTLEEKKKQLREEIKSGNWLDNITGAQQERKEQLYYLESGEVMSYEPGFRRGGGGGAKGHGIVSGDVTRVKDHSTGLTDEDRAALDELDDLIRDRIEFNDKLAGNSLEDKEREELEEALAASDRTIGRFYDKHKELTEALKKERDARIKRIDNPVQKKQTGGVIDVPGYGDGDKVPMLLPPESFVLNKKASKVLHKNQKGKTGRKGAPTIDAGGIPLDDFQKRQSGGVVEAVKHIKKDEALSSLSKGSNDWIRPGGTSVVSGTPWDKVKSSTPIHAYTDSVGVPTIGWGSTYYDDISSGKMKVKMGDVITKGKADGIMTDNVDKLSNKYSKKIPNWKKMSDTQRAGLLSMGYNAPNFYGAYKKVTAALDSGDMGAVKDNLRWGGPSETRIRESQQMMTKGPQNLNAIVGPKIVGHKKVGPKIVGTGNPILDFFQGKQTGGVVDVPGSGTGDKVPMLLPSGAFVLNKNASQHLQSGGVVGETNDHDRFMSANQSAPGMVVSPPQTIIVKRRSAVALPGSAEPSYNMASGGGVNTVEMSEQLHRIQSGAAI